MYIWAIVCWNDQTQDRRLGHWTYPQPPVFQCAAAPLWESVSAWAYWPERNGADLDSEDYDSIGGIIIGSLDRLPEDNEEVTLENGITLKVQGIEQNRILKVMMTLPATDKEEDNSTEESTNSSEEK